MKHLLLLRTALLTSLLTASILPAAYAEDGVHTGTGATRCNNNTDVTCTCGIDCNGTNTKNTVKRLEPNPTVEEATESTDSKKAQNPAGTKDGSYF